MTARTALPALASITLAAIVEAWSVSKSTASSWRTRNGPSPPDALAELVELVR
jgi:hypothetical protein